MLMTLAPKHFTILSVFPHQQNHWLRAHLCHCYPEQGVSELCFPAPQLINIIETLPPAYSIYKWTALFAYYIHYKMNAKSWKFLMKLNEIKNRYFENNQSYRTRYVNSWVQSMYFWKFLQWLNYFYIYIKLEKYQGYKCKLKRNIFSWLLHHQINIFCLIFLEEHCELSPWKFI